MTDKSLSPGVCSPGNELACVDAVWIAGPDAGGVSRLAPGRYFVGRSASAAVCCGDAGLQPHHAQIEVSGVGAAVITQVAGLAALTVDGVAISGPSPVQQGQRVELGDSLLELRCHLGRGSGPVDGVDGVDGGARQPDPDDRHAGPSVPFMRSPRALPDFAPAPLRIPRPLRPTGAAGGSLLPTMAGVAGSVVMAVVVHQVMFLLFGLMGAVVAFATWAAQRAGMVKSRRGARLEHQREMDAFAAALDKQRRCAGEAHLAAAPTLGRALAAMHTHHGALWSVRAGDPDAFTVSLGIGDVSWTPNVVGADADTPPEIWSSIESAARLADLPVTVRLEGRSVIALVGDLSLSMAVARSVVVQLAASSGPADWQLAVVTQRPAEWQGFGRLAHARDEAGAPRVVADMAAAELEAMLMSDDDRLLLLVVDRPDLFAVRNSTLRRLLAGSRPVAAVVLCATSDEVPAVATSALELGRQGRSRFTPDTRVSALPDPVRYVGVSAQRASDAAAAIACFSDPEARNDNSAIPTTVGLLELLGEPRRPGGHEQAGQEQAGREPGGMETGETALARRIEARWRANGADPAPCVPIGVAIDGVVEIDLVSDGPHALIAGTTGSGKSELLRTIVVGLAARQGPDHITFVLVDYKGGSTFDGCAALPHVVGVVTDLDDRLAERALRSLEAELRRREQCLRSVAATDLTDYRAMQSAAPSSRMLATPLPPLPRLVVVIDEFASLAVQQPDFMGALLGVAQRGRSLGVHLILATQRPHGVVSDDIRANTNLRIALRVQHGSDSIDVIGDSAAAALPRAIPGRALLRTGNDTAVAFQAARCAPGEPSEFGLLAAAIRSAALSMAIVEPERVWLPPLETMLTFEMLAAAAGMGAGVVGVIDDPDQQRRLPLQWDPGQGHLLVCGASGMGGTGALVSLGARLALADPTVELFVIDAMGDARLHALESAPHCAGVVGLHQRERLVRLLALLDGERRTRKVAGPGVARSHMVLMIDGVGALRSALDADDRFDQLSQLDSIMAEGPAVGIVVVLATNQPGSVPSWMLSHIAQRWIMHLADPLDAVLLGVPPALVPAAVPGRLVDATSRREAQLALCDPTQSFPVAVRRQQRSLGELPTELDSEHLPSAMVIGDESVLPVGLSFEALQPSFLPVAGGEHVLVIGPSRSGRTTAVGTIVGAWMQAHPAGWVASMAPRRSSARAGRVFNDLLALLERVPGAGPALIVLDDAELIDDHTGALTALIASRRDGVTVLAAGRPEALRAAYGHWTTAVRRSRLGLVMAACTDIEGDLLGVVLPRRLPIVARPGLAWLVSDGTMELVQVARPVAPTGPSACTPPVLVT